MTPISINSLSTETLFHIFSLAEKSPKNLLAHRSVCKQWNENIMEFFCSSLKRLKTYTSKFDLINQAIQQIPENESFNSLNVIEILKTFNATIANYRETIHPWPIIPCKQEIRALEQQLQESESLLELWKALPISNKPELKTIAQIRKWFENEQNQPLLEAITTLDLRNREISCLPREIFKLHHLTELDLSENLIEKLPTLIKVWTHLEELDLHDNRLTCLPDHGMKHLKNLKRLFLSSNLIEVLPDSIGVWIQLEELDLCDNKLEYLPDGVEHLRNLRILNISSNQLNLLSPSMGELKNLEKLDVGENFLMELPSEIGQCTSLKTLKVSRNFLLKLPKELKSLTSLIKFDAFDNQLGSLPKELSSWKKIEKIRLAKNDLNITKEQAKQLWPSATEIDL
ncbi:MAG: hypothetical protein C5B45_03410 [Chlamydiae bacterium]|nr:MAG: hypothetical protein C5B45_03410 [Chlamydiota bacterium]